ncbi:MAG TPA: hypothetical protein VF150_07750 [Thermoanaerobaculia bacterium]
MAHTELPRPGAPKNPGGSSPPEFDRDLDIRAVVWTGVVLAAITAAAFVFAWFFFQGLAGRQEARDPEPLPMPEAAEAVEPPGPRLQSTPEEDLREMLAAEAEHLETYGLVGEDGQYARIPIERAMELALERGLGRGTGAPSPAEPQETTTEGRDAQ